MRGALLNKKGFAKLGILREGGQLAPLAPLKSATVLNQGHYEVPLPPVVPNCNPLCHIVCNPDTSFFTFWGLEHRLKSRGLIQMLILGYSLQFEQNKPQFNRCSVFGHLVQKNHHL